MNSFGAFFQDVFEGDDFLKKVSGGSLALALDQTGERPAAVGTPAEPSDTGDGDRVAAVPGRALVCDADLETIDGLEGAGVHDTAILTDALESETEETAPECVDLLPDRPDWNAPALVPAQDPEPAEKASFEPIPDSGILYAAAEPDPVPTDLATTGSEFGAAGFAAAPVATGSLATLAHYLNGENSGAIDFWDDVALPSAPFFNLKSWGANAKNGVLHYNVTGTLAGDYDGVTGARADMIRHALNVYEDILGIDFQETSNSSTSVVDLFFFDSAPGAAYANFQQSADGSVAYGWVNIGNDWDGYKTAIGSYAYQTALHEIGHVLGLGHQGNYNATSGIYEDNYWQNDSWQQSMMSYWSQTDNTDVTASYAKLIGPMAVDWLALENIYGSQGFGVANGATGGDTTWGFNGSWTNWSASASGPGANLRNSAYASMSSLLDTNAVSIIDGGGIDTLDLSGFGNNSVIDVRTVMSSSTTGSISSVGGLIGNLTLAVGTVIENVVGGAGSEKIYGNDAKNTLTGNAGNDTLDGGIGNDTLLGGNGHDSLLGRYGDDVLDGGAGNDTLEGGNNNDTLNGGDGADQIHGGAGKDMLSGGGGNDTLDGGGGNDLLKHDADSGPTEVLDGGNGKDTASWKSSTGAWTIDLATGTATDSVVSAQLIRVEHVIGSAASDTITGSAGQNRLNGGDGDDSIAGGGGDDVLFGRLGNDTLRGEGNDDRLVGNGGQDRLDGGDGRDTLIGGSGSDTLNGGGGNDTLKGGGGDDAVNGGSGDDHLEGNGGNDLFIFADGFGQDTLVGFNKNDLEDIDLSAVTGITGFDDLTTNHLVNSGGTARIVDGANSILLDGVAFADVGVSGPYSADDFIF